MSNVIAVALLLKAKLGKGLVLLLRYRLIEWALGGHFSKLLSYWLTILITYYPLPMIDDHFYYFAYGSCMCPVDLKRTMGEKMHPYVVGTGIFIVTPQPVNVEYLM